MKGLKEEGTGSGSELERRGERRECPEKWDLGQLGCSAQKTGSVRGLDGLDLLEDWIC